MVEWLKEIPNWLPFAIILFGIQSWALKIQYSTLAKIAEIKTSQQVRATADDARFKALELDVSNKVDAEGARNEAHKYAMDMQRIREQVMQEIKQQEGHKK